MNCIGISCNLAEAKCVGDLQGKLMLIPSPETAQDLMPTQREVMAVLFLTLLNDKILSCSKCIVYLPCVWVAHDPKLKRSGLRHCSSSLSIQGSNVVCCQSQIALYNKGTLPCLLSPNHKWNHGSWSSSQSQWKIIFLCSVLQEKKMNK